jgi:PKHD-type hydroxylase
MAKVEWIDGKKTTGSLSKNVKQNQQLPKIILSHNT